MNWAAGAELFLYFLENRAIKKKMIEELEKNKKRERGKDVQKCSLVGFWFHSYLKDGCWWAKLLPEQLLGLGNHRITA